MYKFLTCLSCDFLKQGKGRVNEIEESETSKCLSFQAFLSACLSHGLFSTLDGKLFSTLDGTSDVQSFRNGCNIVTLLYAGNSFFTFQMILHAVVACANVG